ncbi:hypothetical protein AYI68_g507 [Smittium mucronatum]|uniref:Uncharacterized protein n=1 Tax=Smittium mucronatum TaxID=133383 RepID=A0A1R0H7Z5_9FUNG|nr:hypothetical protein AYI68_g507 [Smittium mucronatum]
MEPEEGTTTHQCKVTVNLSACTQDQRVSRPLSADILRIHDNTGVREEIWREKFPRITWYSGRDMDSLSKDKQLPKSSLSSIHSELSGCSEQISSTNRLFDITRDILDSGGATRSIRCGSISITSQQESENILQLAPGCEISGT